MRRAFRRQEDIIYGRKDGVALTAGRLSSRSRPTDLALSSPSAADGFPRNRESRPPCSKLFLTMVTPSSPSSTGRSRSIQIPDIIKDMNRSVRFVRHNAARFGINPDHIGVSGLSSGGHLALIIGTQGGKGDAKARDAVDRESSAVQCVACFFPPTDFLNYGGAHTNVLGEGIAGQVQAGALRGTFLPTPRPGGNMAESISPIYWITTNLPPTLIIQGDSDLIGARSSRRPASGIGPWRVGRHGQGDHQERGGSWLEGLPAGHGKLCRLV